MKANRLRFDRLAKILTLVLILSLSPLFLFPPPSQIWFLLALPLLFLLNQIAWGRVLPVTPLNLSLLAFCLMLLVSLSSTGNLVESLPKITGILLGLAIFFTTAEYGKTHAGFLNALCLFCLIGMGIALLSLTGTKWAGNKLPILNALTLHIPSLSFGLDGAESGFHPNEVAGTVLWVLPVTIGGLLSLLFRNPWGIPSWKRGLWAFLLLIFALVEIGVLIFARSRTAFLAIILSFILVCFLAISPKYRHPLIAAGFVILSATWFLVISPNWQSIGEYILDPTTYTDAGLSISTFNGREGIWIRAIGYIKEFPLTGIGLNRFRTLMYLLAPRNGASTALGHAHNELLQASLDLGLPGMIAFLALNLSAFGLLFQLHRHCEKQARATLGTHWLILGLFASLFSHFLFGLTDAVSLGAKPGLLFWMLLGLVAGLYQQVFAPEVRP